LRRSLQFPKMMTLRLVSAHWLCREHVYAVSRISP
jgi:hypothetical protein